MRTDGKRKATARGALRAVVAAALAALILGCPSTRTRRLDAPLPIPADGAYRHEGSGTVFPPVVADFRRERILRYDREGQDVSVGYNRLDTDSPVAATVYVYPAPPVIAVLSPSNVVDAAREQLMTTEFEETKAVIMAVHPRAKLLEEGESFLTQNGIRHRGRRALFAYEDQFAGAHQPLMSLLLLFRNGDWSVKYRITYPLAAVGGAAESQRFLDAFQWGGPGT